MALWLKRMLFFISIGSPWFIVFYLLAVNPTKIVVVPSGDHLWRVCTSTWEGKTCSSEMSYDEAHWLEMTNMGKDIP